MFDVEIRSADAASETDRDNHHEIYFMSPRCCYQSAY
jgi:hypothetical protein